MNINLNLIFALLISSVTYCQPDSNLKSFDTVGWLRRNLIKIDCNKNFNHSDVQRELADLLADKSVVILGEPTHGDGQAFLAKGELIRFLHEKMGYTTLLFESGMYDVKTAMDKIENADQIPLAIDESIARVWSQSEQVVPLFEYIQSTYNSSSPLKLGGIDVQFNGTDSLFIGQLNSVIMSYVKQPISDYEKFSAVLRKLLRNHLYTPDKEGQDTFLMTLNKIKRGLKNEIEEEIGEEYKEMNYWILLLNNIESLAKTAWHQDLGYRERQMGENLIWLSENEYKNEKIILWIASVYAMRNRNLIDTMNPDFSYDDSNSMGDVLKDHFKDSLYSIAFTAGSGTYGAFYWSGQNKEIGMPSPNSFEALIGESGINCALLNLQDPTEEAKWLSSSILTKVLGYSEMKSNWNLNLDGIYYLSEMTPSTRRK